MDWHAQAESEIEGLHRFFESWFRGVLPNDDATFSRLERALAPGFQIIFPSGKRMDRAQLLAEVRGNYGSRRHQGERFSISIRSPVVRWEGSGACLATYEEWQSSPSGTSARLSSVLFQRQDDAPEGLQWLHLHECWLPS